MSDLSNLERDTAPLRKSPVDLHLVLEESVAALPELPDRSVPVELRSHANGRLHADVARLQTAIVSILSALRREVVTSDRLIVAVTENRGASSFNIAIGPEEQIADISAADPTNLARFDEWRGGSGLSLAIARRIIGQHGGALFSPPGDGRAGAVVTLPRD
jgi:hypothetical protein